MGKEPVKSAIKHKTSKNEIHKTFQYSCNSHICRHPISRIQLDGFRTKVPYD